MSDVKPRARPWHKRRVFAFAIVLLIAFLIQVPEYKGWFAGPTGRVFDSVLRGTGVRSTASDFREISLVEIDDKAYDKCFDQTSPLKPKVLWNLVKRVLEAHPLVIGVDVLTDATIHIDEYKNEIAAELNSSGVKIIWALGADDANIDAASFWPWLRGKHDELLVKPTRVLGFQPTELLEHREIAWGVPVFPFDEDSYIRRFPRNVELAADIHSSSQRDQQKTWARQIAEEFCNSRLSRCTDETAEEIYLSYSGAPASFKMGEISDSCRTGDESKWDEFRADVKDTKAVLIGGTFKSSGGFYQSPIGRIPGLLVNAYAVRAEIQGAGIHEVRQPFAFLLDVLVGVLMVLTFEWVTARRLVKGLRKIKCRNLWLAIKLKNNAAPARVAAGLLLLVVVWTLSRWLSGGSYLIGIVGVATGTFLHQFWDLMMSHREHQQ